MIINIINEQDSLPINSDKVEKIISEIIKKEKCICDEVTVHFVDTKTICDLHESFFQDPSPTDCISFPMDEEEDPFYRILGEIFVCPETAIKYAKEHQIDPFEETTLYIIHSMLHLLGYDDIEDQDRQSMRQAEMDYLNHLKENGLGLKNCQ